MARPTNLNPKRVWLEDKDCERMTRSEFAGVRALLGAVNYIATAEGDLQRRLRSLDNGRQRMAMLRGGVKALADDLVGTMSRAQAMQMSRTMADMQMQMVPKLTPGSRNVILRVEQVQTLVMCAKEKCNLCTAMDQDARKCELYKVLEAITPLEDYGNGSTCPYYRADFDE